eukprot:Hpha_TRINITY_DN29690_c0_g1::TRINITY_DN29690_c0_g1_i1::g.165079::m.165079
MSGAVPGVVLGYEGQAPADPTQLTPAVFPEEQTSRVDSLLAQLQATAAGRQLQDAHYDLPAVSESLARALEDRVLAAYLATVRETARAQAAQKLAEPQRADDGVRLAQDLCRAVNINPALAQLTAPRGTPESTAIASLRGAEVLLTAGILNVA